MRAMLLVGCVLLASARCPALAVGQDQGGPGPIQWQEPQVKWELRDGKLVPVPVAQKSPFQGNPQPQTQPPQPGGGKAELIKKLAQGDPFAWGIVGGVLMLIAIAFGVVKVLRREPATAKPLEPATVIEEWRRRRVHTWVAAFAIIPAVLVGIAIDVAVENASVPWATLLLAAPVFFVAIVIGMADWRCPACGANAGKDRNPTFCSQCGVKLKETETPKS